jgi:hypothetical protein
MYDIIEMRSAPNHIKHSYFLGVWGNEGQNEENVFF